MSDDARDRADGHGTGFWVALVAGWAVIGSAVVGVVADASDTHPVDFLLFFAGGAFLHDLVLAPIVMAIGWLVIRRLPAPERPVVAGALIVMGTVSLYAFPFVRGYGRDPSNASLLPNSYGAALAAVLAAVAVLAVTVLVVTRRRRHRSRNSLRSTAGEDDDVGSHDADPVR
jgi:drug/metabolite transporter (DMT)-like permease